MNAFVLGEAIKCYKCSSYSDLNCAKTELLKSSNSNMANMADCDLDRRPSYAQPGQVATKCAYMTIKGKISLGLMYIIIL